MRYSAQLKTRPIKKKKDLSYDGLVPEGNTTISRLISILKTYTHVDPIQAEYSVGPLVPDLDMLGADINVTWKLPTGKGFWSGEIERQWTVKYLAAYIDLKIAAAK
jgi:hypothetical protein